MLIVIGCTYGRLNVHEIFYEHNGKRNIKKVRCVCSCWKQHITSYSSLSNWECKSCWCLKNELSSTRLRKQKTTHWETHTRFFKIYMNILWRTRDKSNLIYWSKWITCQWNSYEEFRSDMYESYLAHVSIHWEKNTSIDRMDSSWDYTKDNCRWSTALVQSNNTSRNRMITYQWRTQSLALWCKELWLNYNTIRSRIYCLWKTPDEAFNI